MKKMKFNFKVVILLLIGLVTLGSCSDNEFNEQSSKINATSFKSLSVPGNNANPYDSVGILHNAYCDLITIDLFDNYTNPNTLEVEEFYDFVKNDIVNRGIVYDPYMDTIMPLSMINNIVNSNNYCIDVIQNSEVSDTVKTIILDMFENIIALSSNTYSDYKSLICEVETNVLSSMLSEKEKAIILSSTSVARYSLYYWYNNYSSGSKEAPRWLQISLADIAGACNGSLTGGAAGAGIGVAVGGIPGAGTGVVVGGAIGAVGGAIIASLAKADAYDVLHKPEKPKE